MLRTGEITELTSGCPIEAQQPEQIPFFPQRRAQDGEEAAETVIPRREECDIAQKQVGQERGPHLPAHGVGTGCSNGLRNSLSGGHTSESLSVVIAKHPLASRPRLESALAASIEVETRLARADQLPKANGRALLPPKALCV